MIAEHTVFLVVDDADSMRKINSNQLTRLGARQIVLANNGREALAILNTRRVDVIVSDWNMPVMTGLELLLAVRSDPRTAHLPFIMITAECEREQITRLIDSGVSSILIKPYNPQNLTQQLEQAMRHRPRHQPLPPPAPAVPAGVALAAALGKRRPTLLAVDDLPENLGLIAGLFKPGYRVRLAQDGQTALNICTSSTPPDLILLDVMMPNMDGFELAEQLRSHPQASQIPLIFTTAMNDPEALQRGLELGAVDFVHKPLDMRLLKLRVGNLLRHVERHNRVQAECNELLLQARLREEVEQITRHDLKAPLSAVLGIAHGLLDGGNLLPGQKRMLRLLEDNTQQALNLINLSAALYRIETGRFELQPEAVDVAAMLTRMVEALRVTYQAKALVIELCLPDTLEAPLPQAWADPLLCYSLLSNLLKNACEAAPLGSRVRVEMLDDEQIGLRVENQPAVPAEFRPVFFDKYSTRDKQGGSGLGTYSARRLAQAQGGSLDLQVDEQQNLTCLLLGLPSVAAEISIG
jgi:CheY-like chemotaxis protein